MTTTPRLDVHLVDRQHAYAPGDKLQFQYHVAGVEAAELVAIESSVIWHTEGKGDEDLGVHFFDRRTADTVELGGPATMTARLPNSPLSYDGVIIKILWFARVRVFLRKGRSLIDQTPFRLLPRISDAES